MPIPTRVYLQFPQYVQVSGASTDRQSVENSDDWFKHIRCPRHAADLQMNQSQPFDLSSEQEGLGSLLHGPMSTPYSKSALKL